MRAISGFPGYFATEGGNIYSIKRRGRHGGYGPLHKLVPTRDREGYLIVNLYRGGKPHLRMVHRLVLETFIGPRPLGMECCHGPSGKLDNSIGNLVWGTRSKNYGEDRVRDGTHCRGERHPFAKLNSLQARVIRRAYSKRGGGGLSGPALARVFLVSHSTIGRIIRMESYV